VGQSTSDVPPTQKSRDATLTEDSEVRNTEGGHRPGGVPVRWVQLDLDVDDHDHLISPEERLRTAMARQ
jgi:hypothetical protein